MLCLGACGGSEAKQGAELPSPAAPGDDDRSCCEADRARDDASSARPRPRDAAVARAVHLDSGPNAVVDDLRDREAAAVPDGLPCDVAAIVSQHCASCHGKPLLAPVPLLTAADFAAPLPGDDEQPVYRRARARLSDAQRPMPPRGAPTTPSDEERALLDAWLARGAPAVASGCEVVAADAGLPAEVDRSECEYDFELRVHGKEPDAGFLVPEGADVYECFNFAIPWDMPTHGLRFEPIIDHGAIMHHWTLSTVPGKLEPGSQPGGCPWGERTQIAGWAPGSVGTVLPKHVGVRMPSGASATFQLEMHYNNVGQSEDVFDRSGVRVCATRKLRANEAIPVVLGGLCFGPLCGGLPVGRSQVTNTCLNLSTKAPAHVLWTSPHMHKLGRHLKTTITRADGGIEVLTDQPYDYNDQRDYPSDKLIHTGDALTTTCTFENDTGGIVKYGERTQDEMCFNFLMVYPPESISTVEGFCLGL